MEHLPRRSALVLIAALTVRCSTSTSPTQAPQPPASPPPNSVSGMVLDEPQGVCVDGATVEVVRGQGLGQRVAQTTPCSYWDNYAGGFGFRNLTPGVELTLRATAPGWTTQEKTVTPTYQAVYIYLSKLQ